MLVPRHLPSNSPTLPNPTVQAASSRLGADRRALEWLRATAALRGTHAGRLSILALVLRSNLPPGVDGELLDVPSLMGRLVKDSRLVTVSIAFKGGELWVRVPGLDDAST